MGSVGEAWMAGAGRGARSTCTQISGCGHFRSEYPAVEQAQVKSPGGHTTGETLRLGMFCSWKPTCSWLLVHDLELMLPEARLLLRGCRGFQTSCTWAVGWPGDRAL